VSGGSSRISHGKKTYSEDSTARTQPANESQGERPMLVLTRKTGEEIIINGEICVTVVRLRGNRVQLGIKAPPTVAIRRRELKNEGKDSRPERTPVACT
jgi:carbon storage regulator